MLPNRHVGINRPYVHIEQNSSQRARLNYCL